MKQGKSIGQLKEYPIREAFPHEAHHFTVWLADNLKGLSDVLGFDLVLEHREFALDGLRADLVCKDSSGNRVVIENQLESSDDDHFIRLIQYMGKLDANTAIWITPNPTPKHREIIQFLNMQAKPGFAYYLVKVRTIQIDDSRPYPLFSVYMRPEEQVVAAAEIINREAIASEDDAVVERSSSKDSMPATWCFYPQRNEKTYELFLDKKIVGLGFGDELGDLSKLEPTLEDFKNHFFTISPQTPPNAARTFYTMFYSFVHRIKIGDWVVYAPTWHEPKIYIGKIAGDYTYKRGRLWSFYGHRRSVEWIAEFARSEFSPEALRGIVVTLAVFRARNQTFLDELKSKIG